MDDGVPLRALAAELVGIYRDAPTLEDEEYAAEAIDDLLDALDDDSDDEALVALLDLPETELTAPLLDDVISMLADTGPRVVARLLDVALTGLEPTASRALDAVDRMDDGDKADGFYDVLAGRGPDDLRRTAADELVALGHAGVAHLQDAFADPWTCELVRAAVAAVSSGREAGARDAGPGEDAGAVERAAASDAAAVAPGSSPPPRLDESHPANDRSTKVTAGESLGAPVDGPWPGLVGGSAPGTVGPLGPDGDALEAEFRAYLDRFERESGA